MKNTLRYYFLQWVSKAFDVTIITATQKKKPPRIPIMNGIYKSWRSDNPFEVQRYVKVLRVINDYVEYFFCRENGSIEGAYIRWSLSVKDFNSVYVEKE